MGVAGDVVVNVIPDPLTTVVGRVVDGNDVGAEGIDVEVFGLTAVTGADGAFSIPNVPTIRGDIVVTARRSGWRTGTWALRTCAPTAGWYHRRWHDPTAVGRFPTDDGVLARLELNGDLTDSSGNGRHATLIGGEFVATALGTGLHVGPDDPLGIDWSEYAGLLSHPYTVEIVLTPADTSGFRKIFSFDDSSDNGWYYNGQGIRAYPNPTLGGGQVLPGELHYIAFVSTAPDQIDVYFQGVLLGSTNASFTAPPSQAIFFRDDAGTGRSERLDAVVEAMRISGVARTAEEIAAIQQNLSTTVPDNRAGVGIRCTDSSEC